MVDVGQHKMMYMYMYGVEEDDRMTTSLRSVLV
jgi:hypothetical protein